MRTTREFVIQAASEIADRDGLSGVSLKAVAAALQIRTPSLYNHIDSLDGLLREIAHAGMREMNRLMTQAAVGCAGDQAIQAIGAEYLRFMIAHPGVYETIQWTGWHRNQETERIWTAYEELLGKLAVSCEPQMTDPAPTVRLLAGFLHGYTTQQLAAARENPAAAMEDLTAALDVLMLGIHQKYSMKA